MPRTERAENWGKAPIYRVISSACDRCLACRSVTGPEWARFFCSYFLMKEPDHERSNLFRRTGRPGRRTAAGGVQFLRACETGGVGAGTSEHAAAGGRRIIRTAGVFH